MVYNSNSFSVNNPSSECAQRKKDSCKCCPHICQCCCISGADNWRTYEILKKICRKIFQEFEKEQSKEKYTLFDGGNSINLRIHRSSEKQYQDRKGEDPCEIEMRNKYNDPDLHKKVVLKSNVVRETQENRNEKFSEKKLTKDGKRKGKERKEEEVKDKKGKNEKRKSEERKTDKKDKKEKGDRWRGEREKGDQEKGEKEKGENEKSEKKKGEKGNSEKEYSRNEVSKKRKSSIQKRKSISKNEKDEPKKPTRMSMFLSQQRKPKKTTGNDDGKRKSNTYPNAFSNKPIKLKQHVSEGNKKNVKKVLDSIPVINDLRGKVRRGEVLTMTQKKIGKEFDDNHFPQKSNDKYKGEKKINIISTIHKEKPKDKLLVTKKHVEIAKNRKPKRDLWNLHRMDQVQACDILRADMEERDLQRHRMVCSSECNCSMPCVIPIPCNCNCTYTC